MIENYFKQYDNIIQPKRYPSNYYISKGNNKKNKNISITQSLSNSTFSSKKKENINLNNMKMTNNYNYKLEDNFTPSFNEIDSIKYINNNNNVTSSIFQGTLGKSNSNNNFRKSNSNSQERNNESTLLKYKKNNMFLRENVSSLERKNKNLKNEIIFLKNEIENLKIKESNSTDYILKLEKQIEIYKNKERLNKITKSKNKEMISNNSNNINCSELKNLENNSSYLNELKVENEKLHQFREKIFKISICYNEINENAIDIIRQINNLFIQYNQTTNDINLDSENENSIYQNLKISSEQLIDLILKDNQIKREEYMYLLNEKEKEIKEMKILSNNQCNDVNNLKEELKQKDKIIEKLKKEVLNSIMKNNDKKNNNKKMSRAVSASNFFNKNPMKNSFHFSQNNTIKNKESNSIDNRLNSIERSLNSSLTRINGIFNSIDSIKKSNF